jgi:pilus assembly protein CpaE
MRDVQRIAIVGPSDVKREELRNVLLGMETVWLEAECSRFEFFSDVIRQSQPDVAVISLDSDQAKALALIGQLTSEVPELPILAISARGDGQAILQALRSGAREFLTAPVVLEELLKALQRLQRTMSISSTCRASATWKATRSAARSAWWSSACATPRTRCSTAWSASG